MIANTERGSSQCQVWVRVESMRDVRQLMGGRVSKWTTNASNNGESGVAGDIASPVVYLRLKGHWGEWDPLHPQWQHWGEDWLTQDLSSATVWDTTGTVEGEVEAMVDGDISLWGESKSQVTLGLGGLLLRGDGGGTGLLLYPRGDTPATGTSVEPNSDDHFPICKQKPRRAVIPMTLISFFVFSGFPGFRTTNKRKQNNFPRGVPPCPTLRGRSVGGSLRWTAGCQLFFVPDRVRAIVHEFVQSELRRKEHRPGTRSPLECLRPAQSVFQNRAICTTAITASRGERANA